MYTAKQGSTARAFITKADESPAYWQIGNLWRVMATGVQTGTTFTLLDQILMGGGTGGPCTHTHVQDEGLYVIKGKATFNAGGIHGMVAGPGTFINIPSLTEHSFVVNDHETHILNFYLPAGFEQLLIGISHPATTRTLPEPGTVPLPPPSLVDKLAADYGQVAVLGMPFKDKPAPERMLTKPLEGATVFPYAATAKEMPAYWYENGLWSVLADGKQTGGVYSMLEKLVPQGIAEIPHVHLEQDEIFYILEGTATFLVGDRLEKGAPGDLVFIPRGTIHGLRVDSDTMLFLNIHTPAGLETLLPILADVATERSLPPPNFKPKTASTISDARKVDLFKHAGVVFPAVSDPLL